MLADAVAQAGDREHRDIADIYAITDKQLGELVYADPAKMMPNPKAMPESDRGDGAFAESPALCLVALYAKSEAEGPAASHPRARACAVVRPTAS